jgi:hypothetical protein
VAGALIASVPSAAEDCSRPCGGSRAEPVRGSRSTRRCRWRCRPSPAGGSGRHVPRRPLPGARRGDAVGAERERRGSRGVPPPSRARLIVSVSTPERILPEVLALRSRRSDERALGAPPGVRGIAPYVWVLRNGERETGVTVHVMNERLDTGPDPSPNARWRLLGRHGAVAPAPARFGCGGGGPRGDPRAPGVARDREGAAVGSAAPTTRGRAGATSALSVAGGGGSRGGGISVRCGGRRERSATELRR